MKLTLPWPPSTNAIYQRGKRNGLRLSQKVRDFRENVLAEVYSKGLPPCIKGPVAVRVEAFPPDDKTTRDLDNIAKPLGDALQAAQVILNDKQIKEWHLYWIKPEGAGRVEVTVTELQFQTE